MVEYLNNSTTAGTNAEVDELIHELQNRFQFYDSEEDRKALRSVNYLQGVGKFLLPKEDTWASHRMLVRDPQLYLGFSADNYPLFDQRVAMRFEFQPFTNKGHRAYPAYDVLRQNVAIVRNYIMGEFFPDSSVDAGDEPKIRQLAQIGDFLGEGLHNSGWFSNPLKPKIDKDRANMPGTGAQYLYDQIHKRQTYHSWIAPLMWPVYFVTGRTYPNWGLPGVESSPFSEANLQKPPPLTRTTLSEDELRALCETMDKGKATANVAQAYAEGINQIGDSLTQASHIYRDIEMLEEPTRRESVEIAKDILRKLKVKIGEAFIEHGLSPEAMSNFTILESLKGVVQVYEFHLNKLTMRDPKILENPAIMQAGEAIGKLGFVAKMEALRIAESNGNTTQAKVLYEELLRLPKRWQHPSEQKFKELLGQLESGLDTVMMRMAQMSDHDPVAQAWRLDADTAPMVLDASIARKAESVGQAIQNDAYYRDLNNNQRAAEQHESVTVRNQQMQGTAQSPQQNSGQNAGQNNGMARNLQQPGSNKTSLSGLIDDASMTTMRNAMQTDPNAAAKLAQQQQQRQQAVINRERQRREQQRQQQARLKAQEATSRAAEREKAAERQHHDDHNHPHDEQKPPVGGPHKKQGGHSR